MDESEFEALYNAGYNSYMRGDELRQPTNTEEEKEAWLAGWNRAMKDFEQTG